MEIDHVFASGAVVGRATTHSWGRPAPRCARSDGRPHSCVVARPTTAPDAKTWSIPTPQHAQCIYPWHESDNYQFKSIWPSDATWRHRSRSTLVHVMACCLVAQCHYLKRCWLFINEVPWHSTDNNIVKSAKANSLYKELKIIALELRPLLPEAYELRLHPHLPWANWLTVSF